MQISFSGMAIEIRELLEEKTTYTTNSVTKNQIGRHEIENKPHQKSGLNKYIFYF